MTSNWQATVGQVCTVCGCGTGRMVATPVVHGCRECDTLGRAYAVICADGLRDAVRLADAPSHVVTLNDLD